MMKKDRLTELFEAGKITITCQSCGTPWKDYEKPEKCPFCGSKLETKNEIPWYERR